MQIKDILSKVDHTELKQTARWEDIKLLCDQGVKYGVASVCIPPSFVKDAVAYLDGKLPVCTVIGFPNGYNTSEVKCFETKNAIENGADEIDMVINLEALKNEDFDYIKDEIEEIRDSIDGHILKVIIETCYLSEKEIKKMTEICNETFVNFIKTSTGFGPRGASVEDLKIINKYKNDLLEIKASGGIKNLQDALDMINNGATRLGTSSGVEIMKGEK